MTDKKSPVPDFTTWKLLERKSFFFVDGQPDFVKKYVDEGDGEKPFWCGHVAQYDDPSGTADGIEIEFFNYGPVLKIWGLKTEDYYNGYAILRGADWEFFPGKDFVGIVTTIFRNNNGKPASVFACLARIEERSTGREIVKITVPRDLLSLPPIK